MGKRLFIVFAVIILAACNQDKQAKLGKLISQRDMLNEEIKKLQDEIAKTKGKDKIRTVEISYAEVKKQAFGHYIEVQGKVDGEDNVAVNAKTIGVITDIFVNAGDEVKKGQVLAQIDDQVLRQSVKEVQTQIDFVTDLYNKQKSLWEQKVGSEVQYLSAKTNKEAMENRKATLLEQLGMNKIVSPINGTVEDIPVKVGQSVAPGFPVFRVINFSKAKVVADIAEAFSSKIKKGDDVVIYFPDINKEIIAKINFSSKYINPTNRTFTVEIKLPPDNIEYRANMIAVIKIKDYHSDNAITLPVNIVQADMSSKYVYIIEEKNGNKIAKKQIIKEGQSYNGLVEITGGLKEGDKVVSVGYQNLEDGQAVKY
ncbi:MAG: efflux RND transporter periplasmic adaptor subunit [Bacteroidales bacterium]|nr:efflux RND transporter periplasmic adaptor subunit [Bacteroidales bacterium]